MTATSTPTQTTETTTPALADFEVTNECQCRYCHSCEAGFQASYFDTECPECDRDGDYLGDCLGCFDDMSGPVLEAAAAWFTANPTETGLYVIDGKNLGWQRRSGYKVIDAGDNIIDAIAVDTTWRQTWTINPARGGEFTATMSHHDVPTGSSYSIRPASNGEVD